MFYVGVGSVLAQTNLPIPPDPNGMVVGPTYKVADIAANNDLVKLSAGWWGLAYDKFPPVAGMKAGDYSAMDNPGETDNSKVVMPAYDFRSKEWTPVELPPLSFKFMPDKGLVEVNGFLREPEGDAKPAQPLPTGVSEDQAVAVKALVARYGKPSRIIGYPSMPGLGAAYVWDFDKAMLSVSTHTFRISPPLAKPTRDSSSK